MSLFLTFLTVAITFAVPATVLGAAWLYEHRRYVELYKGSVLRQATLIDQRDALITLYVPKEVKGLYHGGFFQTVDTESIGRDAASLAAITSDEERRNHLKKRLGLK